MATKFDEPVRRLEDISEADCFMIHTAVTMVHKDARIIMPGQTNEKDREVIQLAAEFPMRGAPYRESDLFRAFSEMAHRCIERARKCGLTKP